MKIEVLQLRDKPFCLAGLSVKKLMPNEYNRLKKVARQRASDYCEICDSAISSSLLPRDWDGVPFAYYEYWRCDFAKRQFIFEDVLYCCWECYSALNPWSLKLNYEESGHVERFNPFAGKNKLEYIERRALLLLEKQAIPPYWNFDKRQIFAGNFHGHLLINDSDERLANRAVRERQAFLIRSNRRQYPIMDLQECYFEHSSVCHHYNDIQTERRKSWKR